MSPRYISGQLQRGAVIASGFLRTRGCVLCLSTGRLAMAMPLPYPRRSPPNDPLSVSVGIVGQAVAASDGVSTGEANARAACPAYARPRTRRTHLK